MNARAEKERPPAGEAAEGLRIGMEANAGRSYRTGVAHDKAATRCSDEQAGECISAAYRSPAGRVWRYSGKRARVLTLLASGQGVTQWDTLPWHTRLGGTIHVLREDGAGGWHGTSAPSLEASREQDGRQGPQP
jgi:hypothetical protein